MISKNGRTNTDFQLMHFLAGSCHTPDGAYALLCDLRRDRKDALALVESSRLREQAKRIRASQAAQSEDEAARLEALADLSEMDAHAETVAMNIAAAQAELATLDEMIARLQPHRRFRDLPDAEAHEAAQRDEWRLELMTRAENYLFTSGTIPHDHFAAMRQHPDAGQILAYAGHLQQARADGKLALSTDRSPVLALLEAPCS